MSLRRYPEPVQAAGIGSQREKLSTLHSEMARYRTELQIDQLTEDLFKYQQSVKAVEKKIVLEDKEIKAGRKAEQTAKEDLQKAEREYTNAKVYYDHRPTDEGKKQLDILEQNLKDARKRESMAVNSIKRDSVQKNRYLIAIESYQHEISRIQYELANIIDEHRYVELKALAAPIEAYVKSATTYDIPDLIMGQQQPSEMNDKERYQEFQRDNWLIPNKVDLSPTSDARSCFVYRKNSKVLQQYLIDYAFKLKHTPIHNGGFNE